MQGVWEQGEYDPATLSARSCTCSRACRRGVTTFAGSPGRARGVNPCTVARRTVLVNFDIDRYKDVVGRLDDSDIDYGRFATERLPDAALRCLGYMHDVEHHTICYLRDLLVTRAHRDSRITTFLSCWAFEELWHGEAIGKVLAAHGEPSGAERLDRVRRPRSIGDRLSPLTMAITSAATEHLTAVHMTWGAINEWTTQAGYARLGAIADHPVLSELLRRIMKQEGRHIDFYASEASRRLERSPAAQRLTRWALRHRWAPVGSGVMPDAEVDHLIRYLFEGDDGRQVAARIDRRIDRFPGLDGLGLVSHARASRLAPAA